MNPFIEFTKWLLKWALIIFGGLIALGLVVLAGAWSWHWWDYARHVAKVEIGIVNEDDEEGPLKDLLRACTAEHPIFIRVSNNSSRTVTFIRVDVSAYVPGYSTNILPYDAQARTDRIIPPGTAHYTCWRFKAKPGYETQDMKKALFKAQLGHVSFASN
jgi:hypothetical protein